MHWIPTDAGYELTIKDARIVARNKKGKELAAVPAAVKKTEVWDQLDAALSVLHDHDAEAGAEVERWLLRSLPVPRAVLCQVWADESWRSWLTDLVVATEDGEVAGFLRAADADGLGVVDLDGESVTISADRVLIPHPVLLADLDDLREFSVELGIKQRFDQLFREVHRRPDTPATGTSLEDWAGGRFREQRFAAGRATSAGFRISGGYAVCPCYENGELITARYWIGAEYIESETWTGELHWTKEDRILPVAEVGPLAYSEGVRMATYIYAGRSVDTEEEDD